MSVSFLMCILSTVNRYDQLREDSKILGPEDEMFRADAIAFWDNEFGNAYDDLDETAAEEIILKKGKRTIFRVKE